MYTRECTELNDGTVGTERIGENGNCMRIVEGVYRVDHAIIATQRAILKVFHMNADSLKKMVNNLQDTKKCNARKNKAIAGSRKKWEILRKD